MSILAVEANRDTINSVSMKYGVPAEIIGGIIYKEFLTRLLPDSVANIDTFFDLPIPGTYHSTGLGAIFPNTARSAWEFVNPNLILHPDDSSLQYRLSVDTKFNIETIAVLLIYEARNANHISDPNSAKDLTLEQWKDAVVRYNGFGDKAHKYANQVYEYLNDISTLLR